MRIRLLGLGIFLGLMLGALSISTALASGPLDNNLINVDTNNGIDVNVGGNNGVDVSVTDNSASSSDQASGLDVNVGVNDPVAHTSDPTDSTTATPTATETTTSTASTENNVAGGAVNTVVNTADSLLGGTTDDQQNTSDWSDDGFSHHQRQCERQRRQRRFRHCDGDSYRHRAQRRAQLDRRRRGR